MNVRVMKPAAVVLMAIVGSAVLWIGSAWPHSAPQEWVDVNDSMSSLLAADQQAVPLATQPSSQPATLPAEEPQRSTLPAIEVQAASQTAEEPAIDINKADAATLDLLPGIGAKKADAIIQYREEHGPFRRIEDIKNVKGIGDKMFAKMKDRLSVGNEG
jgi:competence protein ComEA